MKTLRHFLIVMSMLAFGASEAEAQRAGSRIGRDAQPGNAEDAELALGIMARCVVARRPDLVSTWMVTLPGTREERELVRAQADDLSACMDSNELVLDGRTLSFQPRTLRRPVALAYAERKVSEAPEQSPASATTDPWFMTRLASLPQDASVDRMSLGIQDFGHCVVVNAWSDARALFRASAGSEEEAATVRRLTPALGPCLTEGATINITRRNLRLLLAEPFYHVLTATPSGGAVAAQR
jgi:hypothetical protein